MEHLAGIICVSDYIKNCFLDGLPLNDTGTGSVHSVLNGTSRSDELHTYDKSILIIGRMVPEKGILPACRAIAQVLADFLIGLYMLWEDDILSKPLLQNMNGRFIGYFCRQRTSLSSRFSTSTFLKSLQNTAAISVVPSLWAEPCGLTGLEALHLALLC